MLIERAVRKKVLTQKPYRDIDYVLALDDQARVGALRFRLNAESPFLAAATESFRLWCDSARCCTQRTPFTTKLRPPRICVFSWALGRRLVVRAPSLPSA